MPAYCHGLEATCKRWCVWTMLYLPAATGSIQMLVHCWTKGSDVITVTRYVQQLRSQNTHPPPSHTHLPLPYRSEPPRKPRLAHSYTARTAHRNTPPADSPPHSTRLPPPSSRASPRTISSSESVQLGSVRSTFHRDAFGPDSMAAASSALAQSTVSPRKIANAAQHPWTVAGVAGMMLMPIPLSMHLVLTVIRRNVSASPDVASDPVFASARMHSTAGCNRLQIPQAHAPPRVHRPAHQPHSAPSARAPRSSRLRPPSPQSPPTHSPSRRFAPPAASRCPRSASRCPPPPRRSPAGTACPPPPAGLLVADERGHQLTIPGLTELRQGDERQHQRRHRHRLGPRVTFAEARVREDRDRHVAPAAGGGVDCGGRAARGRRLRAASFGKGCCVSGYRS